MHLGKTPLYDGVDDKLRPVLMDLSPFYAKRVQAQWTKYMARRERYLLIQRASDTTSTRTVRYSAAIKYASQWILPTGRVVAERIEPLNCRVNICSSHSRL